MSLERNLENLMTQEKLWSTEGRRGFENLCTVARMLGYKDPMYFGQLSSRATVGDLIEFFEDNPGAIQAVIAWIGETNNKDWNEEVVANLHDDGDDVDGDDEEE